MTRFEIPLVEDPVAVDQQPLVAVARKMRETVAAFLHREALRWNHMTRKMRPEQQMSPRPLLQLSLLIGSRDQKAIRAVTRAPWVLRSDAKVPL